MRNLNNFDQDILNNEFFYFDMFRPITYDFFIEIKILLNFKGKNY